MSRNERPAGPGLPESTVWCVGLLMTQAIGAIGVALLALTTSFGLPRSEAQIQDAVLLLESPPYPAILIGCGAVIPVAIGIPLVLLRCGSTWRHKLRFEAPRADLITLALGATIPLAIVSAGVQQLALLAWDDLGMSSVWPATDAMTTVREQFVGGPFLLLVSIVALGPAVIEEMVFRGLIGRGLIARWGLVPGVLLTTVLFALVHVSPPHALAVVPLGLFLHFVYLATGSLKASIGLHFANNLFAAAAMRFDLASDLEVGPPLLFISAGTVLAISGLIWQHRDGASGDGFAGQTQAVAGAAVGGFTVLFVAAAL